MDEDLWLRINEIHSRYIELDDSQEKLEYEHELGGNLFFWDIGTFISKLTISHLTPEKD